jgi:CRISPR system Cascade subunit CasC
MTRTILDIHILQNVPPSNLNRDDTGTPKTATYGGIRRARVSSQAWKRAARKEFNELLPASELGVRTKKVAQLLCSHIRDLDPSIEQETGLELAAETLRTATGSKIEPPKRKAKDQDEEEVEPAPEAQYLMFLSRRQVEALAELAVTGSQGDLKTLQAFFKVKENKARAKEAVNTRHSVDVALFGRMVADAADINVEAAAQVAHALSVHGVEVESDYFTAVDDRQEKDQTGADMIGLIDFTSATLYRYAAVDIDRLHRNLGIGLKPEEHAPTPTRRATEAFLEAFITSMPTGKINTFANHTMPAAVIVKLRTRRPISFASAFERPVTRGEEGGFLEQSCLRLANQVPELEETYGIDDAVGTWVLRIGEETEALDTLGRRVALHELIEEVGAAIDHRLEPGK